MKIERINASEVCIKDTNPIKVTTCGNVIETMAMDKVNRKGPSIVQLGNDRYIHKNDIDLETGEVFGEIKQFVRTENRAQNLYGMAKSMKAVRDLVNCNISDVENVRWMTFTYAEAMTDAKRLYDDRKAFWKRVVRWHQKKGYPVPEYISAVEPQGDGKKHGNEWHAGTWHLHEFWIYPSKAPYLPNKEIAGLWKQGFVKVKKLDSVDNAGAYLTSYLTDLPLEECEKNGIKINGEICEKEIEDDNGKKKSKKFVKGGRLHLYPSGMNFYRTSRGVKRPEVEWTTQAKAIKKVSGATLTFEKAVRLSDNDYTNEILYRYYNTKRKREQDIRLKK